MGEGQQLCAAARAGQIDRLKSLIAGGAYVTYFDANGLTPLKLAAREGHANVIKALLEASAPWNALSSSNLSASDFAMEAGHQEAFEALLDSGIRSELVLGMIARKGNDGTGQNREYLKDRVSFSEDKLMDSEGKAVMMEWEGPLMEAHAKAACSGGGHVRNVGFGMGLVNEAIQQHKPAKHTIAEAHPEVYKRMIETGWDDKSNVRIVFGCWQDVLLQLESYDGTNISF